VHPTQIEQTVDLPDQMIGWRLRDALTVTRKDGRTKAMLLLDELNLHADNLVDTDVEPLLAAIFELADELNVESDKAGPFDIGDNHLRIHWLLRRLTLDRFDLPARSKILMGAAEKGALVWLIDFAQSAYRDYYPTEGKPPEPEQKCLTTREDAHSLRQDRVLHGQNHTSGRTTSKGADQSIFSASGIGEISALRPQRGQVPTTRFSNDFKTPTCLPCPRRKDRAGSPTSVEFAVKLRRLHRAASDVCRDVLFRLKR
jgi:hypothetical protein